MDALSFLRADHESVLGMLETLDSLPRGKGEGLESRKNMVTSLVMAESAHEAVEEQFFWPAVRRALPEGDDLADTAIAQEEEGKVLLQQLEKGEAGDAEFEQALAHFIFAAREHIEFEQNQVWPRIAEALSAEELESLGEKMMAAKRMAPSRPHPHTPSDPGTQSTMGMMAAAVDKLRDRVSGRDEHQPPQAPPS